MIVAGWVATAALVGALGLAVTVPIQPAFAAAEQNAGAAAVTSIAAQDRSIALEFGKDAGIVGVEADGERLPFIAGAAGGVELRGVGTSLSVARHVRVGGRRIPDGRGGAGMPVSLVCDYAAHTSYISLTGTVTSRSDVPFQARFTLPIDARDWTWQQDLRSGRQIEPGETYADLSAFPRSPVTSIFPLGTLSRGNVSITIAVPLDAPRVDRISYGPAGFEITYDLGASPAATKLGGASFSLILYASSGKWGLRGALEKYYAIYPQFFVRRTSPTREGIWYLGSEYPLTADHRPDASFAKDYGIGINQVAFGTVRDLPTGGYYENGYRRRIPWDNATGALAAAYLQPWGAKFLPSRLPISYDALLAEVREAAAGPLAPGPPDDDAHRIKREANATLTSAARDRNGRLEFELFPSVVRPLLVQFYVNPEVGNPDAGWMSAVDADQINLPFVKAATLGGRIDAFQIDSIVGIYRWNAAFDYDRSHWATATMPLSFDPASGQVAELLAFPNYRMLAHIADIARRKHIIVSGNNGVPGNRAGGYIGSDLIDYFTLEAFVDREIPLAQTDAYLMLKRAMAFQRPISSLHKEFSAAAYDADLRRELFYGVYTGVEAGRHNPFYTPAVRAEFKRFIPLVRKLSAAGWQPVPYARSSNRDLWLERYGSLADNSMYLTVRNPTDGPQSGTITVLPQPGNYSPAGLSARDEVSAGDIPLAVDAPARGVRFALTLAAHDTAMIRLASETSGGK